MKGSVIAVWKYFSDEKIGNTAAVFSILFQFPQAWHPRPMADISRARALRKQRTWAQKLVWSWLRDRKFCAYKFRREHPVGKYYLDFFCEEARLSIELDGSGHGFPAQRAFDEERTRFLGSLGIKELRFWNSRLRPEKQSIRDAIFRELQARAPHALPDYTQPMKPLPITGEVEN